MSRRIFELRREEIAGDWMTVDNWEQIKHVLRILKVNVGTSERLK
jgi:hypothetical protein